MSSLFYRFARWMTPSPTKDAEQDATKVPIQPHIPHNAYGEPAPLPAHVRSRGGQKRKHDEALLPPTSNSATIAVTTPALLARGAPVKRRTVKPPAYSGGQGPNQRLVRPFQNGNPTCSLCGTYAHPRRGSDQPTTKHDLLVGGCLKDFACRGCAGSGAKLCAGCTSNTDSTTAISACAFGWREAYDVPLLFSSLSPNFLETPEAWGPARLRGDKAEVRAKYERGCALVGAAHWARACSVCGLSIEDHAEVGHIRPASRCRDTDRPEDPTTSLLINKVPTCPSCNPGYDCYSNMLDAIYLREAEAGRPAKVAGLLIFRLCYALYAVYVAEPGLQQYFVGHGDSYLQLAAFVQRIYRPRNFAAMQPFLRLTEAQHRRLQQVATGRVAV